VIDPYFIKAQLFNFPIISKGPFLHQFILNRLKILPKNKKSQKQKRIAEAIPLIYKFKLLEAY